MESETVQVQQFLHVQYSKYLLRFEPNILEETNRWVNPEGKSATHTEFFPQSILRNKICKLCIDLVSWCNWLHVHFSHSPLHHFRTVPVLFFVILLSLSGHLIVGGRRANRWIQDYSSYLFDLLRLLLVCWGCYVISLYNLSYLLADILDSLLGIITFVVSVASKSIWSWTSWVHLIACSLRSNMLFLFLFLNRTCQMPSFIVFGEDRGGNSLCISYKTWFFHLSSSLGCRVWSTLALSRSMLRWM